MKIGMIAPVLAAALTGAPPPDDGPRTITIRTTSPEAAMRESFAVGDHAAALEHIDRALRSRPDDPLLLYNRACAKAQLGQHDRAAAMLMDALRHGFSAFSHMQRDSDLKPIRAHPTFRAIVDARKAADDILAQRRLDEWRDRLSSDALEASDDRQRLHYLVNDAVEDLDAVRRNVDLHLMVLNDVLFDDPPGLWCLIVLPHEDAGRSLLGRAYTHGHYRHNAGVLIALDRSVSLQHELVHLLHHRHMDELGQQHPIWIQEGLATLFERYEITPDGSIHFLAGQRQNLAKQLLRDERIMDWPTLFALDDCEFNREAHRLYAQVDSILRFLADQRVLRAWYQAYVEHFETDPTGREALEFIFEEPIGKIEGRWRWWLNNQPFHIHADEFAINQVGTRNSDHRDNPVNR